MKVTRVIKGQGEDVDFDGFDVGIELTDRKSTFGGVCEIGISIKDGFAEIASSDDAKFLTEKEAEALRKMALEAVKNEKN